MDQVSIILGPNFIISFKEKEVDVSIPCEIGCAQLKERSESRERLPAYSMIDAIVDQLFCDHGKSWATASRIWKTRLSPIRNREYFPPSTT